MRRFIEKYPAFAGIIFTFICLIPLMWGRDFTPDNELRYLQIADEALDNGSIFAFTNNGQPYADKPPLFLWFVMLGKLLFGEHCMFALSLLSFIPAAVIALVMDKWLVFSFEDKNHSIEPGTRLAMVLMLFTTGMFCGTCFFLRMDMMMTMFIILALSAFYRSWRGCNRAKFQSWLLPLWIFLALFTKGPVGLLMPLLSIAVFLILQRDWRSLGKYLGIKTFAVLIILCALWLGAVWLEGGKDYFYELTVHQTVGRGVNAFTHQKPFWYYFEALPINLVPYIVFTLPLLFAGLLNSRGKGRTESFLATSAVVTFVMLSCFSSKLAIYLLPIVPTLVYCIPLIIDRLDWSRWMDFCIRATAVLLMIVGAVALFAIIAAPYIEQLSSLLGQFAFIRSAGIIVGCALLTLGSILTLMLCGRKAHWSASITVLATSLLLCVFSASFEIKLLNPYIGYGDLCAAIPQEDRVVTLFVRRSENMKVYLHRDVIRYEKDLDAFLAGESELSEPTTLVVTTHRIAENPALQEYIDAHATGCHEIGEYSLISLSEKH